MIAEKLAPVVPKVVAAVKPKAVKDDFEGLIFIDGVYHIVFVWGASQLSSFVVVLLVFRFTYKHRSVFMAAMSSAVVSAARRRKIHAHAPVEVKKVTWLDKILVWIFYGK